MEKALYFQSWETHTLTKYAFLFTIYFMSLFCLPMRVKMRLEQLQRDISMGQRFPR